MKSEPWRTEAVEVASTLSKHLVTTLTYAGSMGTRGIGEGNAPGFLETIGSLLSRGDAAWHQWFHDLITKPLVGLFAATESGLTCEALPVDHTKAEESKRGDEIKAHRDKIWAPYQSVLSALDFFVRDFPRGLPPPQDDQREKQTNHQQRSDDQTRKAVASHVSFADFMNAGLGQFLFLPITRWPWAGATQTLDWEVPPWDSRVTGGPTNLHVLVSCLSWLTKQKAELLPEIGKTKTGLQFPDTRETHSPSAAKKARVDEVFGVISGVSGVSVGAVHVELAAPNPVGVLKALALARGQLRKLEETTKFPDDWKKHQPGQSEKERLRTVAKALEQVARWMKNGGQSYRGKLRKLSDDLDSGRGLPAHAKAVDSIRERLESSVTPGQFSTQPLLDECAERFDCLARGIEHFCDAGALPPSPHPWEAPSHWPLEAREAAQRINGELHRAAQFCATWTLTGVPADHPCHEPDCAQELWAIEWHRFSGHHSDKMNAKVHIGDNDLLRVKIRVEANAPAAWRALEQVLGQIIGHNQEVDGHKWTRSHLDCAVDDMPDFYGYAKRLGELAISWRGQIANVAEPSQGRESTSVSEVDLTENEGSLAAVIRKFPGILGKELAIRVNLSEETVRRHLGKRSRLFALGFRQKEGRKGYFPPLERR